MVNKRKVRLMARTAMYESHEGKDELKYSNFFRSDYVGKHMVYVAVGVTLAYLISLLLICVYNYEYIISNITVLNYYKLGSRALVTYVLILLAFQVLAYFIFAMRYNESSSGVKFYLNRLKKIDKMNKEEKNITDNRDGEDE